MTDIVERLRQAYHNDLTDVPLLIDAADEIERLLEKSRITREETVVLAGEYGAEIDRLRAALAWIDNHDPALVAAAEEKFGFELCAAETKP